MLPDDPENSILKRLSPGEPEPAPEAPATETPPAEAPAAEQPPAEAPAETAPEAIRRTRRLSKCRRKGLPR